MSSGSGSVVFKLDKEQTRDIIINVAPQYIELLRHLQSKGHWVRLPEKFETIFRNLKLDGYVCVFDDERFIVACFGLFLMGKEGFKDFNADLEAMSLEEQMTFTKEWLSDIQDERNWSWMEDFLPDTPEKEAEAQAKFNALSDEEREEASKRALWFWCLFFGWFYQYLALMLHGQKLTSLVAQAKSGDLASFAKAVHIEPRLLTSHPFFRDRYEQARANKERNFLMRVGSSLANQGGPGRIQYPGLYVVFTILEAAGWLDDGFTHEEILDMCDKAKLDRWQNRIEDVGYLTKRLNEYRKRIKFT